MQKQCYMVMQGYTHCLAFNISGRQSLENRKPKFNHFRKCLGILAILRNAQVKQLFYEMTQSHRAFHEMTDYTMQNWV